MNDNFSFEDAILIHRVSACGPSSTSILWLLNPAHPKPNPVSFLSWRLRMGSDGVR
jgi:hypothetical protein